MSTSAPVRTHNWEGGLGRKAEYVYLGAIHLVTGYGAAAREHLKALARAGLPICGRDIYRPSILLHTELVRDDHEANQLSDERPDYSGPFKGAILHATGDAIRPLDIPTVAYCVWECTELPHGWADRLNSVRAVFTPSPFNRALFLAGGVTTPIFIAPHPIDIATFHPDVPPFVPPDGRPDTMFLIAAQWIARKGIEDALVAYLTEFRADESVGLILFVWGGSHGRLERMRIRQRVAQIREGLNLSNQPRIWYVGHHLSRHDTAAVFAAADVHVCASRGESFCLPVFEAAAMGKPSIITGWGGMWDFLDDTAAYRVAYDMEPVNGVNGLKYYHGHMQWARARIASLRQRMREAHEDKVGRATKGQRALEVVVSRLTHDVVGPQMMADFLRVME